jgi:excisionase family DNA binding protein
VLLALPNSSATYNIASTAKKGTLAGSKQRLLDSHDPNVLLSTNELATLTGFKPKTIRRWVSRKLLNYIRVGNRFRFRLAAVELFLAQREVRK